MKNTSGSNKNMGDDSFILIDYNYPGSHDYYNICVGTDDGTTYPHAYDNYKLGTKISTGTGAGQLVYQWNPSLSTTTNVGGKIQFTFTRTFTNSSGGSIDVKELGMQAYLGDHAMIIRDILPGTVTVNNGQVLTVTYTLKVNESEGFTKNFMKCFRYAAAPEYTGETVKRIDGDDLLLTDEDTENSNFRAYARYGEDYFGIQIGTSTSGIDADAYKLGDQISHGDGPGQLIYHGYYRRDLEYTASGTWCTWERPFTNRTASGISVEEVGLIGLGPSDTEGDGILFIRNLTGGITIQPEETLKIKFKLEANI